MSTLQLSQTPFTPPPSTIEATLRTIQHHKMILHSNKNKNKLSTLLFSNGRAKPKREWKYLKGFPELSSCSISKSKSKCKLIPPSSIKSTPNTTPVHTPTPPPKYNTNLKIKPNNTYIENTNINIVITPYSDNNNETDYESSSSFTSYPITCNPTNKNSSSKNTFNHLSNNNIVIDDSTDYDLSDSDDIHSVNNDNDNDYPWPTSSDDSFAKLDEIEVYKRLKEKLNPKLPSELKISAKFKEDNTNEKVDKSVDVSTIKQSVNKIEIDPKWYDKNTGKYLSFIIHETPIEDNNGYMSEYEGDNEDDDDLTQVNNTLFAMPLQSACTPVDSDVLVCNISDIDE